jgi:MscS family membrane protein
MSDIIKKLYYQNNLQSWGISVLIIIASFILAKVLLWILKNYINKLVQKSSLRFDDLIVNAIEKPAVAFLVTSGMYLAIARLHFSESVDMIVKNIFLGAITLSITWFLVRFTRNFFNEYLTPIVEKSENDLDDQLLPIAKKGICAGIWALGIVVALNNAGFNVGALLAGMGIGGIALAMASKDTISNFFGGITIFTDRPFKLKDRIKINGVEGFVEEIGIRSTRIRTLDGRLVTIPNAKFTDSSIENVSLEPSRKVTQVFGLLYSTPAEKMEIAQTYLREIVTENPNTEEKILTAFTEFANSSLNITLIYYISKPADILQTMNDINNKILTTFNTNELEFAFPTYTVDLPDSFIKN